MPKIELEVPSRMLAKLDKVARVDDLTRSEVVRTAIRDYFARLDWKSIDRDLDEIEGELSESDEDYDRDDEDEEDEEYDEEQDED